MNRERTAYVQGQEARSRQHERINPYTRLKAEKYWYAGYDGIPYEDIENETA